MVGKQNSILFCDQGDQGQGAYTFGIGKYPNGYLNEIWALNALTPASGTWPAAFRIKYLPFSVDGPVIISSIGIFNGSIAAGPPNVLAGIYDALTLAQLGATAITAQAGANVVQIIATTADIQLYKGAFFLAVACDLNTTNVFRFAASTITGFDGIGVREETPGSHSLPATATPIVNTESYLPLMIAFRKAWPA